MTMHKICKNKEEIDILVKNGWSLPDGSRPSLENYEKYQKSLYKQRRCRSCKSWHPDMQFVRNIKTSKVKNICAECYKAGKAKIGLNGRLFSKNYQPKKVSIKNHKAENGVKDKIEQNKRLLSKNYRSKKNKMSNERTLEGSRRVPQNRGNSYVPPPENQANLTKKTEELGGTFDKMGLSDREKALADILLGQRKK